MNKMNLKTGSLLGWRGRIGIIYPASGLNEHEFFLFAPHGISLHFTRVHTPLKENDIIDEKGEKKVRHPELQIAASLLSEAKPHCILWACTSESFKHGIIGEKDQVNEIETTSGVKAITASLSCAEALKYLSAHKVAIGTPYTNNITKKLASYLIEKGFTVVNQVSLGCSNDIEICSLLPEDTYALAKKADHHEADVVLISCAAMRIGNLVEEIESDIGKPVFTSAMAGMWNALRMINIPTAFPKRGTLFNQRR